MPGDIDAAALVARARNDREHAQRLLADAEAPVEVTAPVRLRPSAAVTTSSETVDVLHADALVERDVVPFGAAVATVVAPVPRLVEGPQATPGEENATADEADDPVARMVRSAIERAARAASEAPAWPANPADQRDALRTNRADLS